MNYIKCPNCGKEISSKSTSCIYCGISRGIIEQRLKEKEVSSIKETPSQIEGFINNHKKHIIILEIVIILIIGIVYVSSYLPKIITYSKNERINQNIENCKNYGGNWNSETSLCETDYGIIEMK